MTLCMPRICMEIRCVPHLYTDCVWNRICPLLWRKQFSVSLVTAFSFVETFYSNLTRWRPLIGYFFSLQRCGRFCILECQDWRAKKRNANGRLGICRWRQEMVCNRGTYRAPSPSTLQPPPVYPHPNLLLNPLVPLHPLPAQSHPSPASKCIRLKPISFIHS